jgi:hypothetical protein
MRKEAFIFMVLGLVGCCDVCDNEPPAVPVGVHSVTGDRKVTLYWYPNREEDFAGYFIYRSYYPEGPYKCIGSSRSAFYVDLDVSNGVTYYYAVSAYDYNDNESDLSEELVFDTPRPEGRGVRLWDANLYELDSGYDFSTEYVQAWNDPSTDIYCVCEEGVFYMIVGDAQTDIQDFGYIEELDAINYAPESGWSETGVVELILGHGYIVWTRDNHFAKFRVTGIGERYIKFDWAYQVDRGNRELSPKPDSKPKKKNFQELSWNKLEGR